MFFKFIARIQFLFTSTNEHGVHSPFVFDFVTKGLYRKSINFQNNTVLHHLNFLSKKEQDILQKIAVYFKVERIYIHPKELENSVNNHYKILFLKNIENFYLNDLVATIPKLCLLFYQIHTNPKTQQQWNKICENPAATVIIDLYYFGLVFFRKEQEKEHFKIRV